MCELIFSDLRKAVEELALNDMQGNDWIIIPGLNCLLLSWNVKGPGGRKRKTILSRFK